MCVNAAPPRSEEVLIPKPDKPSETLFRDPTNLTRWLRHFLYASVCASTLLLFSDVLDYLFISSYDPRNYSLEEFLEAYERINGDRHLFIGLGLLGIQLTTSILFLMWIYRANSNARQLGAQGMKFSPGWSVGFYFIPILWFWKPYQAMKEIWQASKAPSSWKSEKPGSILPWW
jgi:hypothetical protein